MKILLISNSARGEAIAETLIRSPRKPEIIVASTVRSPGLVRTCKEVHVMDIMNVQGILALAKKSTPDFAFIAPDDPIGAGLADELETIGIPSVAPKKSLARIESSKSFARMLMEKHGIDASPKFRVFSHLPAAGTSRPGEESVANAIRDYISKDLQNEYVVKYDALKGGKGVKVSGEHLQSVDEGIAYALECLKDCDSVVIEEQLIGVEFSLMSFVSGAVTVDMPAVQDHKRAYEGETGPNTGGMGTYSDSNHRLPFLTQEDMEAASIINRNVAQALMKECSEPYKGILYGGFIVTKSGVKVIEYNARFGDPEVLNVLPLLESDFVAICEAILTGTLTQDLVRFAPKATVCKYITPKSYPEAKKEKGQKIMLTESIPEDIRIYYGDVSLDANGNILLGGSRSVGVIGIGKTIDAAEKAAENFCKHIEGPVRYRSDIGTKELIQKRITLLQELRRKK